MSYTSPERASASESNEDEQITSLEFTRLGVGDQVLLYFDDGRAYWLRIDNQDEQGKLFGKVLSGRKSQFAKEIESWEELSHTFQLEGSCERFDVVQDELFVVGARPGSFKLGERAWFSFSTEEGDRKLTTQIIQEIRFRKSSAHENENMMVAVEKFDNIN